MRKILKENIYRQKLFKRLAVLYPRCVAYQAVNEEMDQILPAQKVKRFICIGVIWSPHGPLSG